MKSSEMLLVVTSFGIKFHPEDIIDYIAIRFSLLVWVLAAIITVVCLGKVAELWSTFLIGFGVYATCMCLCSAMLFGRPSNPLK